jgi:nucleotide-binding universal stress UspA family protein
MEPVTNAETVVAAGAGERIERILCPVDFSEASVKAYRHANSIASHYGAKLIVQYVIELSEHFSACYAPTAPLFEETRETFIANGLRDLHQFVDISGCNPPECIAQSAMAAPDAILSLAQERAISLIVLGTHGRRGFDRAMLGSVTERVLRHATCPVLAVRYAATDSAAQGPADAPVLVRRILCCVDFSAHSRRALKYALSAADAYDAEVTVLHVLDNIPESADVGKETAAAMENLEKLFPATAPRSPKTHLEVRLGKAYQEILKFAAAMQSDLIVTGVRGRNSLDIAVFGSTTYRVIQLGAGSVLTVPI